LPRQHHVQIVIRRNVKHREHAIEHFAMLGRDAHLHRVQFRKAFQVEH